ncbi:MAG: hemerythrin, partial [Neptuniibacter pectenicola]
MPNTRLIPQVAIDFMNDDHAEAISIVDNLLAAIENSSDDDVTLQLEAFFAHNQA